MTGLLGQAGAMVDRWVRRAAAAAACAALLLTGAPGAWAVTPDPFPVPEWRARPAASPEPFTLHVPVLMYHRILAAPRGAPRPDLWVSPGRFREQLRALQRAGWHAVTAAELARHLDARAPLPPGTFVITVDDGAVDGFTHALPVLRRLGMVATFCVVPGRVGQRSIMRWRMLRTLRREGHEIAQHSLTHRDLRGLDDRALRHEIGDAQALVRARLGTTPVTFCYPYGHQDARVRRAVAAAGLRLAFLAGGGAREDASDPYRTPRILASSALDGAALVRRVEPFR